MSASRLLNACLLSGGGSKNTTRTICAISRYSDTLGVTSSLSSSTNSQDVQVQKTSKRTMASSKPQEKFLNMDILNPCIKTMEYAVRGPLVIRAAEIEKELERGVKKPFKHVIRANIGDCHAMGQKPISFFRQVMGLVIYPNLFNDPSIPDDIKKRARDILNGTRGSSMGSYTDSAGIEVIRKHVAKYIENRDGGIPSNADNIILSTGASGSIKSVLALFHTIIDGKHAGCMIPIPQYPLYSATLSEYDIHQIGYYLDESQKWGLNIEELERSIKEARKTCLPRVLVVLNPGNPTGQVLTRKNIEEIIKFAYREKLFLMADEVYQDNIYDKDSQFHSFKKVLTEMGEPYSNMELASFMSISKGYMGECGIRGGYAEIINMEPSVKAMLLKSLSAQLCSSTIGQAAVYCAANPPKPGEPSYDLFISEKNAVLESLKKRAEMVTKAFNSFEGFSCNPVMGAMYAFPQFHLPPKAIEAAEKVGQKPDVFYAFQLLERTGICIVPGSGFGQREGTYHFRTTILPQEKELAEMLQIFDKFHKEFMKEYK